MAVSGCIWQHMVVYGIWEGSVTTWRVARWVVTTPLFDAIATNNSLNLKQEKQSQNSACSIEENRTAHQLAGNVFSKWAVQASQLMGSASQRFDQRTVHLDFQRIQILRFPSPLSGKV